MDTSAACLIRKNKVMIWIISIQLFCWMFGKRNLELPFLSVSQPHTSSILTCALIIAFDPVLLLKRVWHLLYVHLKNNMLLSFFILFFLCEITGKDMIINVMTESWVKVSNILFFFLSSCCPDSRILEYNRAYKQYFSLRNF